MKNELLNRMATDMGIQRFTDEQSDSYIYRLCYSALGLWCLNTSQNSSNKTFGTTKHNQTIVLSDLLMKFVELFPTISDKLIGNNDQQINLPVKIRRVYEETGYMLTNCENKNIIAIANFGRSILIGNRVLFFGLPNSAYTMNGLGVYANTTDYMVAVKDFLIRDELTCEEYFHSRFDHIDFYDRDIDLLDLEFFNPKSDNVPSGSWSERLTTNYTIARRSKDGPFYRIMKIDRKIQFADEPVAPQSHSFTSYEYRRLIFALKAHYKKPLKAIIIEIDDVYSKIRIGGYLPNREYYFMLLISWPERGANDKVHFVIKNDLLPEAVTILSNIGIEAEGDK